jgi:hypothetical protein
VYGAIDLNDQMLLVAIEVCDELANRRLAANLQVAELMPS